ncbi:hypothetical protein H4R18_002228 [Coemansia javaensis]|uniref:Uncharacterized protein n=1 Tax=Coemansia javaensis TaxID=2761396 RepID=A0A9W8LK88_9FUNG|nr:hypothetical protein H4R18_002228 [Coemansia javaensis]
MSSRRKAASSGKGAAAFPEKKVTVVYGGAAEAFRDRGETFGELTSSAARRFKLDGDRYELVTPGGGRPVPATNRAADFAGKRMFVLQPRPDAVAATVSYSGAAKKFVCGRMDFDDLRREAMREFGLKRHRFELVASRTMMVAPESGLVADLERDRVFEILPRRDPATVCV